MIKGVERRKKKITGCPLFKQFDTVRTAHPVSRVCWSAP